MVFCKADKRKNKAKTRLCCTAQTEKEMKMRRPSKDRDSSKAIDREERGLSHNMPQEKLSKSPKKKG